MFVSGATVVLAVSNASVGAVLVSGCVATGVSGVASADVVEGPVPFSPQPTNADNPAPPISLRAVRLGMPVVSASAGAAGISVPNIMNYLYHETK